MTHFSYAAMSRRPPAVSMPIGNGASWRLLLLLLLLLAVGCGLDSRVGQSGTYVFVSDAPVVDSAAYPLQHVVIVEQDAELDICLVYLFSGDIGAAGLGLPDLRRIARGFGRAQMAFDLPRSHFAQADVSGYEAGPSVTLGSDTQSVLVALDDMGLQATGASRWLSSVKSDDYAMRAYFAALECKGESQPITVALEGGDLTLPAKPLLPELATRVADQQLTLDYGDAESADYMVLELWQAIAKTDTPDQPIEAVVRTSLPPRAPYAAGASLVNSAAGQGCWSLERPIGARVTQIAREYVQRGSGDAAIIRERIDGRQLDPELWTPLTASPVPAEYCQDYTQ